MKSISRDPQTFDLGSVEISVSNWGYCPKRKKDVYLSWAYSVLHDEPCNMTEFGKAKLATPENGLCIEARIVRQLREDSEMVSAAVILKDESPQLCKLIRSIWAVEALCKLAAESLVQGGDRSVFRRLALAANVCDKIEEDKLSDYYRPWWELVARITAELARLPTQGEVRRAGLNGLKRHPGKRPRTA